MNICQQKNIKIKSCQIKIDGHTNEMNAIKILHECEEKKCIEKDEKIKLVGKESNDKINANIKENKEKMKQLTEDSKIKLASKITEKRV